MATPARPGTNLPAPVGLTAADFTAALKGAGFIESRESTFNRIKVDGTTFYAGDEMYISNPKTNAPAFLAQIVDSPLEYQAYWFNEDGEVARAVNRPEIAGHMCKSHFDIPEQAREYAEDGTPCRQCPINPFVKKELLPIESKGFKCSWRGDIQLRILDEEGKLADETIWTLSLPTTGMIEFKGTSRDAEKGHVGELNFMQQLVRLGASLTPDQPNDGLMKALTALRLGGVVTEVRSVPVQSATGNRYNVVQFTPIQILDVEDAGPALTAGTAEPEPEGDGTPVIDDLPF